MVLKPFCETWGGTGSVRSTQCGKHPRLCQTWKTALNPFNWDVWWCLHNERHSWLCQAWKMVMNLFLLRRVVVLVLSTQTLNPFYWDMWWCLHNRRHSWSRLWRHQPCVWCMIVYPPPPIPAMRASKKTKCLFDFKLDTGNKHLEMILKHIRLHRVHWYKSHCSAPIGKGV